MISHPARAGMEGWLPQLPLLLMFLLTYSYHLWTLLYFLLYTWKCYRLTLHFSCPSPWIKYFFKDLCFFVWFCFTVIVIVIIIICREYYLETEIWTLGMLSVITMILFPGLLNWEAGKYSSTYMCAHIHIHTYATENTKSLVYPFSSYNHKVYFSFIPFHICNSLF